MAEPQKFILLFFMTRLNLYFSESLFNHRHACFMPSFSVWPYVAPSTLHKSLSCPCPASGLVLCACVETSPALPWGRDSERNHLKTFKGSYFLALPHRICIAFWPTLMWNMFSPSTKTNKTLLFIIVVNKAENREGGMAVWFAGGSKEGGCITGVSYGCQSWRSFAMSPFPLSVNMSVNIWHWSGFTDSDLGKKTSLGQCALTGIELDSSLTEKQIFWHFKREKVILESSIIAQIAGVFRFLGS